MVNYLRIIVLSVLVVNFGSILLTINVDSNPLFKDSRIPILGTNSLEDSKRSISPPVVIMEDKIPSISIEKELRSEDSNIRYRIQQQNETLLNQTIDEPTYFEFIPDIWGEVLGSDEYNHSLFTNGLIDPYIFTGEAEGASLFTRIGNYGIDETTADRTLSAVIDTKYDISNISAGWQMNFPIQEDYDIINISFKWRFDALNAAFDNYSEIIPDFPLDPSSDYQEIRCRIIYPNEEFFWIGNPVSNKNPNGTVFYRIGPDVTQDEIWVNFEYSFQVEEDDSANFTLELGAYLNSRENWNEYFDVWFDEILILGITNMTDINPPQPITTGLGRTEDISEFNFWANFSEGTWETPIKNVTVFYNQSGTEYDKTLYSSLNYQLPSYVNNAGYNQTRWEFTSTFNFSDNITFYFMAYDYANNSFVSETQSTIIGDLIPPEIKSTVINQTGTGLIIFHVNVEDWGYGVDTLVLNYTIDGEVQDPIYIAGNGRVYQANFTMNISQFYGSTVEFGITLNDTVVGNSNFYSGAKLVSEYPIVAENDIVKPEILDHNINASSTTEGRTIVNVSVVDNFGEISEVYVEVSYENGTPHDKYSHVSLENSENSTNFGVYILRSMDLEKALKLPFNEFYFITFVVVDKAGNENRTKAIDWIPPDILPPKLGDEIDLEYIAPGLLRVWIQASDEGSGIESVWLEFNRTKGGPVNYKEMKYNEIEGKYYVTIDTGLLGNEQIAFRINAFDIVGNDIRIGNRPFETFSTPIFFATSLGLLLTEIIVVTAIVGIFAAIKIAQRQQLKVVRRKRFDIALGRSERLAYLGEEAIFGFVAAYGQSEGISSALMWEPRLIGHFYQYLKELIDKANNNVSFIMQTRAQDQVTFVDFYIEEIACSAITFAYPVSTLPQQWLSALMLDQVPIGGSQGILLLMLLMREKWGEIAHNFQEEIADGVLELKDMILSGEDKGSIISKAQEFRLFISGTLEVLDEIETETDEISDDIMGDFGTEFLDDSDDDSIQDEPDEEEPSNSFSDNDNDS